MLFKSGLDELTAAQQQAKDILSETQTQPRLLSIQNISIFGREVKYACKLIVEEREILFFAILQWFIITTGYLLWIQILDWIPNYVWEEIRKAKGTDNRSQFYLLNVVFCGWSLLIVAVMSYLLSIFSSAIIASHYLRSSNQISTVVMILRRLPKKRNTNNPFIELAYYGWKSGYSHLF